MLRKVEDLGFPFIVLEMKIDSFDYYMEPNNVQHTPFMFVYDRQEFLFCFSKVMILHKIIEK